MRSDMCVENTAYILYASWSLHLPGPPRSHLTYCNGVMKIRLKLVAPESFANKMSPTTTAVN